MVQVNISTTKNNLSKYLERVQQGETILILDRHQPIATLAPYRTAKVSEKWHDRIAFLSKNSKIALPKRGKRGILQPPIVPIKPAKVVEALLEERSTSR